MISDGRVTKTTASRPGLCGHLVLDPVEVLGDTSVDARIAGLATLVTKRDNAHLSPAGVTLQHQRSARVTLQSRK
jgi:hypothetical protein